MIEAPRCVDHHFSLQFKFLILDILTDVCDYTLLVGVSPSAVCLHSAHEQ